jgi:hypothetical protein
MDMTAYAILRLRRELTGISGRLENMWSGSQTADKNNPLDFSEFLVITARNTQFGRVIIQGD